MLGKLIWDIELPKFKGAQDEIVQVDVRVWQNGRAYHPATNDRGETIDLDRSDFELIEKR